MARGTTVVMRIGGIYQHVTCRYPVGGGRDITVKGIAKYAAGVLVVLLLLGWRRYNTGPGNRGLVKGGNP